MSLSLPHPPLVRLPLELLLEITNNLGFRDRAILSTTNRHFAFWIKSPTFDEFLAAEKDEWAISRELYACEGCKRFRRLRQFADQMRKGKRERGGIEASSRFCIECGLNHERYLHGTLFTVLGEPYIVLRRCINCQVSDDETSTCAPCSFTLQAIPTRPAYVSHDVHHYERYDDWEHTTNAYAIGRHSDEMYGVWPDA